MASKLINKIPNLMKEIELAKERALIISAGTVHGSAVKKMTQQKIVDTGRLRNSLSYTINGGENQGQNQQPKGQANSEDYNFSSEKDTAIIGTNVEYAPYIEKGTSKMNARPFLTPAYDENREKIKTIFKKEIGKAGKL